MDPRRDCRPDSNRLRLTTVPDVESSDAGSTGMTMRGLHGRDAYDGTDTGTDSGADAPERHADDPRSPDRTVVHDTETRTALALAYRQRVEAEPATCGPGDATPQGNQSRHSLATTSTEGDHAFRTPADENADSRDADHPKSKCSVRTRLDGRHGTPTFPRAHETCPMPGTYCRTYNWLSSTPGSSAITR